MVNRIPRNGETGWLGAMDRALAELLESPLKGLAPRALAPAELPRLNLWQDAESLHLEAEVPGFRADQIDVSIVDGRLVLRGELPEAASGGGTFLRRERSLNRFERVLALPFEVEAERTEARLEDGVLHLTLPKAQAARPVKIQIQSNQS